MAQISALARATDRDRILTVVADAFSCGGTRQPDEEIAIVRETWAAQDGRPLIELVADEDGTLVGHLQAAPGRLDGTATPIAGVAPVCVLTAAHGRGVGSALVHRLLAEAAAQRRFGFRPASAVGMRAGAKSGCAASAPHPDSRSASYCLTRAQAPGNARVTRRRLRRRPARAAEAECPRSP